MLNGIRFQCLLIHTIILVAGCVSTRQWHLYERKTIEMPSKEVLNNPTYVVNRILELSEKTKLLPRKTLYYLDNNTQLYQLENWQKIVSLFQNNALESVDLHFAIRRKNQEKSFSWLDESLLRKSLRIKSKPTDFKSDNVHKRCKKETGLLINSTELYQLENGDLFFVLLLGRRKFCLNRDRVIVQKYIEAPGSLIHYVFVVYMEKNGKTTVQNYSTFAR